MMTARFTAVCVGFTIPAEGGDKFTNYANDPGGATKFGITLGTLQDYMKDRSLTASAVEALTQDQAEAIYATDFWLRGNCEALPVGVGEMVFDFGVGSGITRSTKMLQALVGLTGADVDGWIGDQTLKMVANFPAATLLNALHSKQLTFVDSIQNSAAAEDRKGWENRVNNRFAWCEKALTDVTVAANPPADAADETAYVICPECGTTFIPVAQAPSS